MPDFGLSDKTLAVIRQILADYPAVKKVILYGSRAKGNYKKGSDIDLTLIGDALDHRILGEIAGRLEESPIPYQVDLSLWEQIDNQSLLEHIERVGVVFYERADRDDAIKSGWKTKMLGEVLQKTKTINPLQSPETEFDYIDVSSISNTTFQIEETQRLKGKNAPSRARRLVKANDVLFATVRPTLRRIAIVPEYLDNQVCSTGYFVLRPKQGINYRFVFYWLFTEDFMGQMECLQKGASYPAVTDSEVRAQTIPVPPLPEQQRIVGILDEAFENIATAKANAEKNLKNSRALFESYLQSVFTQRGEGWVEKRLEDVCVLQRGFDLPTRSRIPGNFPLVSSSGIIDTHNEGPIKGSGVVTGRSGSIGSVFYIEEDYWPLNTVLYVKQFYDNNPKFVYWLLDHFKLKRFATGSGVPTLNRNFVHDEKVFIPKLKILQKKITEQLDILEKETQRLESIYQRKLAALDELKKSLLYQAFSGQL